LRHSSPARIRAKRTLTTPLGTSRLLSRSRSSTAQRSRSSTPDSPRLLIDERLSTLRDRDIVVVNWLHRGRFGFKSATARRTQHRGDVVQLVRTLPCHGRGREFESRRPRQFFPKQLGGFDSNLRGHKKPRFARFLCPFAGPGCETRGRKHPVIFTEGLLLISEER
jgi:hypothetical protein